MSGPKIENKVDYVCSSGSGGLCHVLATVRWKNKLESAPCASKVQTIFALTALMMLPSIPLVIALATALTPIAFAQNTKTDPELVGTWTTKSKTVVTGPVRLIYKTLLAREWPANPKNRISTTQLTRWWKNLGYRAPRILSQKTATTKRRRILFCRIVTFPICLPSEPCGTDRYRLPATNPSCPSAMLQWQHGKYKIHNNGSLVLEPIKVDGRQMYSDPCSNSKSIYTRYNQTETFKVLMDSDERNMRRD